MVPSVIKWKKRKTHVHVKFVNLRQDPADGSIATANQDSEGIKVAKKSQSVPKEKVVSRLEPRRERKKKVDFNLPESRSAVHQIENLSRIEELLETAQKLDALIISRLGVDKDQEWRTSLRPHRFPGLVRSF